MGQSVVKNPKKLYSQLGGDPTLPTRVTTLENNEYKITYYEVVSGASGSLTLPAGATINAGEFGLSGNCVLSKIDGSNKPTFESPKTAGGTVVTASLNETTGAWVASGVYTDANVALIYSIKIKAVYYSNLTYANIIETVDVGLAHLDSPAFTGIPTAPTPSSGDDSTKIATTEFVIDMLGGNTVPAKELSTNGYVKMANGLILQWGGNVGVGGTVVFPISFTNANWKGSMNVVGYSANNPLGSDILVMANITASGFRAGTIPGWSGISYMWIAIGY